MPSNNFVPYKVLLNKDPDYHFLRVLGYACYPLTRPYNNNKFELRSKECVFIGYSINQKGYRCLHIPTNRIYVSRSVQFDETSFPFKNLPLQSKDDSSASSSQLPLIPPVFPPSIQIQNITAPLIQPQRFTEDQAQPNCSSNGQHNSNTENPPQAPAVPLPEEPPMQLVQPNSHTMVTRTKDRTYKKKEFPEFVTFHTSIEPDPTTFLQANKTPHWRHAMAEEIEALANNKTWTLVPHPPNQKVIGCKWVFKTKKKSDGSIERYKARLVAKGFDQVSGVDFEETYSPVVRPATIRLTISLALSFNWDIRQLDVSNAFLNGNLNEKVYMTQPQGFIDSNNPDFVCLLHKSLYGLRQAPRAWFEKLSSTLLNFGFKSSPFDPSMFLAHHDGHTLILLVYVDDIILTGSSPHQVSKCIQYLSDTFSIRDLGVLNFFLGIEATTNTAGLCLTQTKYLRDLLQRVNMSNCKSCASPMPSNAVLTNEGTPCKDPHLYRSVVGGLQYATLTRPDLAFSINKVSQFMHNPTEEHWTSVKRILRYISGTLDYGLQFYKGSPIQIQSFSDADWAGDADDRRSTSGFCVFLGKNLVTWCAKKQPTVSRSSTEAEYRSLALTCQEVMWLEHLLKEIRVPKLPVSTLWCDNIGATFLAANPMFQKRTKHISIDYHFVRERVLAKQLNVRFLCSRDQIADGFTKPLPLPRFEFIRNKLNVVKTSLA